MNNRNADFRSCLLDIIIQSNNRIPKEEAMRRLAGIYSDDVIARGITKAVRDFVVDQFVDYAPVAGEFARTELIWHLKIPDNEEIQKLRALKPAALALLRLLYEQSVPRQPGEMKIQEARTRLAEMGYPESETEYLTVKDRVDEFWTIDTGEREKWFRVIPEHKKTPEYKAAMEEAHREREDREELMTQLIEEDEETERRRERSRVRYREKHSKKQSL